MRRLPLILGFLLVLAAMAQAPAPQRIADLAWLAGEWRFEKEGRVVEEHWTAPAGGTMVGMSRTVARGKDSAAKTREFEFLRIVERDGKLVYIAQPGGRTPPTEFLATSVAAGAVVFENPQHDFPKRVLYRKVSDTCVTATVDAGEGTRKVEFPYCRAPR